MNKPNQLERTCTACGIKKPLSAFLQLGGAQGTSYGSICADCRRTMPKAKDLAKDSEERSSSSSRLRIGAQQKIAAESEKKQQNKDKKEIDLVEERTRDELKNEKLSRTETKLKAEKDHRFYLETKRGGFLSGVANKTSSTKTEQVFQQTNSNNIETAKTTEAHNDQTQKRDTASQLEQKLTTIDLTLPFSIPKAAHNSAGFLRFKQWLGASAPISKDGIIKNLEKIYNKAAAEQTLQQKQGKGNNRPDPFLELVEKSTGPSSGKKR